MDPRFQAIMTAAIERAKAQRNLVWAEDLARRIACSTPLPVEAADLAEQLTAEAVRAGVAVTVGFRRQSDSECLTAS
jgi:hypothetical protein